MPAFFTPTLEQVIRTACDTHGCEVESIDVGDVLGGSVADTVQLLTREVDGQPVEAVLPNIGLHDRVTPEKLREICADLRLPPSALYPLDPWE